MGRRGPENRARPGERNEKRRAAHTAARWQGAASAARAEAERLAAQRIRVSAASGLPGPYEHFDAHWYSALKAADIEDFHFHDLRHTTASMLAAQGASLLEIADVLGHKTLAMVKRYSHLVVDHKAKVIEKMIAAKGL